MLKKRNPSLYSYKYCIIPGCKSTTSSTPEKEFICVPHNELKRKAWCEAVGYPPEKKLRSGSFCCEDHFLLQEDLENYEEYQKTGCRKKLKLNAVPRFNLPVPEIGDVELIESQSSLIPVPSCSIISSVESKHMPIENRVVFEETHAVEYKTIHMKHDSYSQTEPEVEHKYVEAKPSTRNKSLQTNIKVEVSDKSVGISCDISSISDQTKKLSIEDYDFNETSESISSAVLNSNDSYNPSTSNTSSKIEGEDILKMKLLKSNIYEQYTKLIIQDNPLMFLGVDKENLYVIRLLQERCGIDTKSIYMILKKIRTNLPFAALAYEFSVSESQVSRTFTKSIDKIAFYLKKLIVWPDQHQILLNLPIQFRYNYSNVQSIIDCFEIEIEKPSDSINQALTWSEYKKCNTAKYLISITPDGLINFISEGACGRCSDMALVENSGYLEILPQNCAVLADRGFKQLDTLLHIAKTSKCQTKC